MKLELSKNGSFLNFFDQKRSKSIM